MANENKQLSEIQRSLGRLEGKVESGFHGVWKRQDTTNGNIKENSNRIKDIEECVDWDDVIQNQKKIDKVESFIDNLKGKLAVYAIIAGAVISVVVFIVQQIIRGLL